MAIRFWAQAGRTILSKVGFNANDPGLDDRNKIFDSNWNFSAVVIKSGEVGDSAAPYDGTHIDVTKASSPFVINFTDPGYVPCVYLVSERDAGPNAAGNPTTRGFDGFKSVAPIGGTKVTIHGAEPYVTRSQIIIPRGRSNDFSDAYVRWRLVRYVVFGISQ